MKLSETLTYSFRSFVQKRLIFHVLFNSSGLVEVFAISFIGAIFWLLVKTTTGQNLLLNHPRLFSLGLVSHEGPSDEAAKNTHFTMHFEGRGWEEKLASPEEKYPYPPNKVIRTKVTGTNPGYGATCVALLLSARTILQEADKMPGRWDIYNC